MATDSNFSMASGTTTASSPSTKVTGIRTESRARVQLSILTAPLTLGSTRRINLMGRASTSGPLDTPTRVPGRMEIWRDMVSLLMVRRGLSKKVISGAIFTSMATTL